MTDRPTMHPSAAAVTPIVAAAASTCTYRWSPARKFLGGHDYINTVYCGILSQAGWTLNASYKANDTNMHNPPLEDTDAVDVFRAGTDCLVSFHGADMTLAESKGYGLPSMPTVFYGVAGISSPLARELELILAAIRRKHGNLRAWGETCRGIMSVTGHGMGGGLAALFAYMANRKGDPLELGHTVWKVMLFGPTPVADHPLSDDQTETGCFRGNHYYTRVPANTYFDGLPDIADPTMINGYPITAEVAALGLPANATMQHVRIGKVSLDIKGPVRSGRRSVRANSSFDGPTLPTPCDEDAPVLSAMANNATLAAKALEHILAEPYPGKTYTSLALHDPVGYVWSFAYTWPSTTPFRLSSPLSPPSQDQPPPSQDQPPPSQDQPPPSQEDLLPPSQEDPPPPSQDQIEGIAWVVPGIGNVKA
jgi:hypothetical protein